MDGSSGRQVGVDSGGTFTDVVLPDGSLAKLPSTPDDPGRAVRRAVEGTGPGRPALLAHGSTVATNALLEGRLGRVALLTTEGFTDVIEIGRQDRPSLYDPWADRPTPLVDRSDRLEVAERVDASGRALLAPDPRAVPSPPDGCDAVAVCLVHSDLDPGHERAVARVLRSAGWDVSASVDVSPEFREFERTVTTVVNAGLRPVCAPYLAGLTDAADRVVVTTSAGGQVGLGEAAARPVALLLSGPAAGVRAAAEIATACGFPDAVTFDMGGTSTDVGLVLGGEPALVGGHDVAGYPVRVPALEVHTIGAGGGSVARLDAGGALQVGPESAGAAPGPACYGHGGLRPTVTDADLLCGRIPVGTGFPGIGELDVAAARRACDAAGVDPQGVVDVVEAHMEQAIRRVTVERGVDPAGLALVAFGGAGPMHACGVAEAVGIPAVVVPPAAGVLSAVGLLVAPPRRELVRTWPTPGDLRGLEQRLDDLGAEASTALRDELAGTAGSGQVGVDVDVDVDVVVETSLDCRYVGQSHEIRVGSIGAFAEAHRRRNGFVREGTPVEVVAVRAVATAPASATIGDVLGRVEPFAGRVDGPVVVGREDCTVWVPEGWWGEPGPLGSLVLRRTTDGASGGDE